MHRSTQSFQCQAHVHTFLWAKPFRCHVRPTSADDPARALLHYTCTTTSIPSTRSREAQLARWVAARPRSRAFMPSAPSTKATCTPTHVRHCMYSTYNTTHTMLTHTTHARVMCVLCVLCVLCVRMCACVRVCVCVCIYMYIYLCVCVYVHTQCV